MPHIPLEPSIRARSLLSYGDISACSFHATKLFHTIEGGAVITPNAAILKRMALMRNFGHISVHEFCEVGINGKNSEMHAAMGLCNLKYIKHILYVRHKLSERYRTHLEELPISFQEIAPETQYNYSYFPIVFENETTLLKVLKILNLNNVYPRRYFMPSLSELHYVSEQSSPIAEDISRRVLCLPLYHTLSDEEMDMICRLIKRGIRY